jgi:hypothetical protein
LARVLDRQKPPLEDEQAADGKGRDAERRVDDVDESGDRERDHIEDDRNPEQHRQNGERAGVVSRPQIVFEDHEYADGREHVRQSGRAPVKRSVVDRQVAERRRRLRRREVQPVERIRQFNSCDGEKDARAESTQRRVAVVLPSGVRRREVQPRPHRREPEDQPHRVHAFAEGSVEQEEHRLQHCPNPGRPEKPGEAEPNLSVADRPGPPEPEQTHQPRNEKRADVEHDGRFDRRDDHGINIPPVFGDKSTSSPLSDVIF